MKADVLKVEIPKESDYQNFISNIDFVDAYQIRLKDPRMPIETIYQHLFSTMPSWIITLLKLRNKIVGVFGLKTEVSKGHKERLTIGKKAGAFEIYSITKTEIIAGEDDKHLNFHVSVLKQEKDLIVTTFVHYHNLFGKLYMTLITPFHKLIVKSVMKNI